MKLLKTKKQLLILCILVTGAVISCKKQSITPNNQPFNTTGVESGTESGNESGNESGPG